MNLLTSRDHQFVQNSAKLLCWVKMGNCKVKFHNRISTASKSSLGPEKFRATWYLEKGPFKIKTITTHLLFFVLNPNFWSAVIKCLLNSTSMPRCDNSVYYATYLTITLTKIMKHKMRFRGFQFPISFCAVLIVLAFYIFCSYLSPLKSINFFFCLFVRFSLHF